MSRPKRTAASWAKAREAALERDGYACQATEFGLQHVCLGPLVVHHIRRRSQMGGDDVDNLVTLCNAAHVAVHDHPAISYELGLLKRSAA